MEADDCAQADEAECSRQDSADPAGAEPARLGGLQAESRASHGLAPYRRLSWAVNFVPSLVLRSYLAASINGCAQNNRSVAATGRPRPVIVVLKMTFHVFSRG